MAGAATPDAPGAELLAALGLATSAPAAAADDADAAAAADASWRSRAAAPPLEDALAAHAPMPACLAEYACRAANERRNDAQNAG